MVEDLDSETGISHNGNGQDLFHGELPRLAKGWSINALSIELKLDRRTVRKRLAVVEPLSDGPKGPLYSLADAARALFGQPTLSQAEDLNHRILRNKLDASEIDLARKRGEFMPRKEVERTAANVAREEREAWLTWPARAAPILADEFAADQAELSRALEREIRAHMEERSREPDDT
ncbi:MAG: hypothetical protein AAF495_08485 [Pseudomonadota bacterium]